MDAEADKVCDAVPGHKGMFQAEPRVSEYLNPRA